jgi:membrane protein implicated in regulation of membrane protease activity
MNVPAMDAYLVWILAGIALIIAELMSGTFYLLMLGLSAIIAGGVAYAGAPFLAQVLVGTIAALAGMGWVHRYRRTRASPPMPSLDLGQAVTLDAWVNRADHMARVKYRDALWDAHVEGECRGEPGEVLYIRSVQGSTLMVAKERG